MKIATTTKVSLLQNFFKKFDNVIEAALKKVVESSLPFIQFDIEELVTQRLYDTPIFTELLNNTEEEPNMRAEFGLSPDVAKIAAAELYNIIENSVQKVDYKNVIKTKTGVITFKVKVMDTNKVAKEIINNPAFSYNNEEAGGREDIEIDWMKWILEDIFFTFDEAIGILYEQGKGRSGMAYMTKGKNVVGVRYPYAIPDKYHPRSGKNFLEDLYNDSKFLDQIKGSIYRNIYKGAESLKNGLR